MLSHCIILNKQSSMWTHRYTPGVLVLHYLAHYEPKKCLRVLRRTINRVFHAKSDIRKRCHSASKNAKKILRKSFKEHLCSDLLCKDFMGLGQIS